ncbi:alkaline phosphatase family protein [Sphingomonas sp. AOB5]|uniref:nucleotide pyrophosphatase/phosphodiesterase family protein n=1 Tax=Sphingomonas sp. AOB5 TaxID=3034017 RepID=UPI0023F6D086|nr:nucleotide pyrophosphatase/phosphodiesterase family protein [Sphingomonas sp. AOB5]MDF7775056.1 alkaline phosphatase family protein [Sphingomonas sp. AOB5]
MRWTTKLAAAALAALAAACTPATPPPQTVASAPVEQRAPITILISIDGFKPDYLNRGVTPNLSRLAAEGATGPMRPSFPSKTFPNHWTLVTGLRPDRNGITANKMEDKARPGEVFTMSSDDPFWWSEAAPIWVDAEKAGIRTGTLFWPGSNVAVGGEKADKWPYEIKGGTRPSDWAQFNQVLSGEQRVNGVLDWVRRPAAIRPKFITTYFDTVDTAGHSFGPDDKRTTDAVADVDKWVGQLVAGLAEMGQPANIVIVADHGMAATSTERTVALDAILAPADTYRVVENGPYATLEAMPGKEAVVEQAFLGKKPHMECWRRGEIPERFHYGKNPRVPPILCLAETGWEIKEKAPTSQYKGGNHGFDNFAPEMLALFIAHGPAFRAATLPAFDNVDVYPLLRRLIGLPPVGGKDGTDAVFRDVLTGR